MPPELVLFLQEVEASELANAMRQMRWLYPAVNTGHIIGIAMILGGILPLDLRLMGLWSDVPVNPLARTLVPTAVAGIFVAVITGALLFTVDATKYANLTLFRVKLAFIGVAILNALLLRGARDWPPALGTQFSGTTTRLRVAGLVSAGLWLGALICGRLLGYV